MYRQLSPLMKRFIFIRQGAYNRYYEGKLIAIDEECLQLQSFKKDGSEEEVWTIRLDTVTEFSTGGRHLAELELKVQYLCSADMPSMDEDSVEIISTHPVESPVDEF